jgi:hypothetical protein
MMREKLHLTDKELMNKSWIALNLELMDYPYYDYKSKNRVDTNDTESVLEKLLAGKK